MIYEVLPHGKANAIPAASLAAQLGLSSTRQLRAVVESERQSGRLILSAFGHPGGYFQPADGEQGRREIQAYYNQQRALAVAVLKRLKAARQALGIPAGQLALDSEGTDRE